MLRKFGSASFAAAILAAGLTGTEALAQTSAQEREESNRSAQQQERSSEQRRPAEERPTRDPQQPDDAARPQDRPRTDEERRPQDPRRGANAPSDLPVPDAPGGSSSANDSQRPRLGVMLTASPTTGAKVEQVDPRGAAAQAGIRSGDFILEINDRKISTPDEVDQALSQLEPGETAELSIWRNGQTQELRVSFGERREAAFRGQNDRNRERSPEDRISDRDRRNEDARRDDNLGGQQSGQPWLGVVIVDRSQQPGQTPPAEDGLPGQQRGALVHRVYPSGPAARAGLRSGDTIVSIGGEDVTRARDVINAIEDHQVGGTIEIVVARGQGNQTLTATLADRDRFFGIQQDGEFSDGSPSSREFMDEEFPEHALLLEHNRRVAEQHQRIEERIEQVLQELQALRREMNSGRGGPRGAEATPGPNRGTPATATPARPDSRPGTPATPATPATPETDRD